MTSLLMSTQFQCCSDIALFPQRKWVVGMLFLVWFGREASCLHAEVVVFPYIPSVCLPPKAYFLYPL